MAKPVQRTRGGWRTRSGRKPLAAQGLQRRDCKVLASFTPDEYQLLEHDADDEGVTIAELVAQRALIK